MLILSVDPGYVNIGYCIYNDKLNKIVDVGTIVAKDKLFEQKLVYIYNKFIHLYEKYKPDIFVYEEPMFKSKNSVGTSLDKALGVMLLLAGINNAEIVKYAPRQVKLETTGDGKADKNKVALFASNYLNIPNTFKTDHASDSCAILTTYLKLKNGK